MENWAEKQKEKQIEIELAIKVQFILLLVLSFRFHKSSNQPRKWMFPMAELTNASFQLPLQLQLKFTAFTW